MRGFLTVARREILEKRFVFAAAAVASLIPFAAPLVRGLHGQAATEIRVWLAVILAATLGAGLAVALGSTVLSSELADRRLGFYFSRPLTGFAIWAGKLGAACVIALGAAAIVYTPTLAAGGGRVILASLPSAAPEIFAVGVFLAVALCHAASIAVRPRSPLLAVDLLALVLLSLGAAFIIQHLASEFAMEALVRATTALVLIAVIGVVAAGVVAVTRGRTDSRAAHHALSATLWGITGAGILSAAGYASWVLSATPRDLTEIDYVLPASRGNWVMVEGPARGGLPAFLFDTASGRYERAGADWRWPVLSPDGAHAVWFAPSGPGGPFEVMTWKLDDPSSKPVRTRLSFPGTPAAFLSEHGERLATIEAGLLSIYDLASGASLGSVRITDLYSSSRGFFLDANRFRIFPLRSPGGLSGGDSLDILEFDVGTKTLKTTGAMENVDEIAYSAEPSGDRLLVREKSRVTLRDGASGALLASLFQRGPETRSLARFLSDGRIALAVAEGPSLRVEVFAPDGKHERTLPVPARDRIALGGEVAPGKLIVAAGGDESERAGWTIFLADLSSGQIRQVAERLFPVVYMANWLTNRPNYLTEPGSEATKLFYGPGRSLVRLDPLTGERRVILPGSSR